MLKLIIIGIGGFFGSIMRYGAGGFIHRWLNNPMFPYGTLFVNILGCFLIGVIGGLVEMRNVFSPEVRLFLLVGFLGGFTTFSSFGMETYYMIRDGQLIPALGNIFGNVGFGLIAVWLGMNATKLI